MQDIRSSDPKALVRALFAPIAEDMAAVDAIIREELDSDVPRMREIGEHIVNAGGKRMRPALLVLTLMHDDVVDESAVRRGKPTANALWGNGVAVLVGDFLYTRSFQMMIRAGNLRVMQALADAANTLAEGEVKQMVNAHDPTVDEKRYFEVIERKTACLFEAGAKMAAAIADCSEKDEAAVREYALALGNAFQIVDDMLDYTGVSSDIGKNLGADLREGKVTLPLLYARLHTSEENRALIDAAIRSGNGDFDKISSIVIESQAIARCKQRAEQELERGKAALLQLSPSIFRDSLLQLLFYTVCRDR